MTDETASITDPGQIREYGFMVLLSRTGLDRKLKGVKDQRVALVVAELEPSAQYPDARSIACIALPRGKRSWAALGTPHALMSKISADELDAHLHGPVTDGMTRRGQLVRIRCKARIDPEGTFSLIP